MLKICLQENVDESPIWLVLNQLFDVYLPDDLGRFASIRNELDRHIDFELPEVVACSASTETSPAFILSRYLHGEMLDEAHVSDKIIEQLARHVGKLHQQDFNHWGKVRRAAFHADLWPEKLLKTLVNLAHRQGIGEPWLGLAIAQIEQVQPQTFSLIMPDLRWDQFLHRQGKITALVDLDAFVIGPREMELVLLEYLLDEQQAQLFSDIYQRYLDLPDLSNQRLSYRLLLFMMNVLGEIGIDKWMQAPVKF
ncbi:phosphotransferase [Methylophaga sp. OBS4]|uniref:phosphotransferase n=1 Tax=Methylophaga sp. OBS4 TaxID=2991935 RepID=UPI00224DAC9E|nr:phosphotransferase [Methylophaga sp. OBS4]MCX4187270.1 aminoglycoside phosphotransferase family protein [Methylophaga sp. OBS4]